MTELILRDYQARDVDRLRNAYSFGKRAVLYQLATGGGKTVVFSHVIKGATGKGRKTAVIAHRRELITQASDKLDWLDVPHGIMAAGLDRDHDAPVQVCSIQSIIRRLDKLPKFDFVVADEAHHCRAETWAAFLRSQEKAKLLGVTATPARTDGKGLGVHCGGLFDAIVCGPKTQWLVDQGHLARAECYIPAARIDVRGLRRVAGDFIANELVERANAVTGDAIVEYRAKAAGKSAIAFCVTVAHAEAVAAQFREAGYRAECVHGGTPKPERDAWIAALGNGGLDVLTSCDVISEGLDVPSVGCVILLRPTESLIMSMQQIGRGMRPKADGGPLIVLDHAGNTLRHGPPEEDRLWTLDGVEKQAPGIPRDAADEDDDVDRSRKLEFVDGELVLAGADPLARWRRMSYRQFKKFPRSEAQIRAFQQAKGYKPGFVWAYMREQQERLTTMDAA